MPVASPTPQVIIQDHTVVLPAPPPEVRHISAVKVVVLPCACTKYPAWELKKALRVVRGLRHRYATKRDDWAMAILRTSCLPTRTINAAIDP